MMCLRHALYDAVSEILSELPRVGIAFSGGVDSSLLANLCHNLHREVTLLTIGFPGSHDIKFSKEAALKMCMNLIVYEIEYSDFREKLKYIRQTVPCSNTSHLENCIAFLYISQLAKQNNLDLALSANGCDELFCGYDSYRKAYCGGEAQINKVMEESLINEFALMEEIHGVTAQLGVQIKQPFLSPKFVEFAKTIPISQKIKGPDDMIRKHILREAALELGVPKESALKPKKALQYGSSIHKYFKMMEKRMLS
ncbi:MAG: asparagine synthase C-terminal domain-containing protein [Thermoproteota archaeon]|nr:asparagine synthase C-terminal domain-containing protein [Thermoproteota archaeon]